jgi:chemotaxis protein MotB
MNSADSNRPIIVKKVKRGGEGAHGGAWKVAFADFMTSMTALFLVLYLVESATPAEKMAISMYFTSPTGFIDGGSPFVVNLEGGMRNTDTIDMVSSPAPPTERPGVMPDKDIDMAQSKNRANVPTPQAAESKLSPQAKEAEFRKEEDSKFTQMKQSMDERIQANPTLRALKDQIIISLQDDGLQIQIVDKKKRPMFDLGKASVKPYMDTLIKEIAKVLREVPNKLSISGHTDAVPFTEEPDYTNWELSADRANAARRAFLTAGIPPQQIARVVGMADTELYDKEKPDAPINRRTTILVMRTLADMPKRPEKLDSAIQTEEVKGGMTESQAAEAAAKKAAAAGTISPNEASAESLIPGLSGKPAAEGLPPPEERAALPPDEDFPAELPNPDALPLLPGAALPGATVPAAAPGPATTVSPAGTQPASAVSPTGGPASEPVDPFEAAGPSPAPSGLVAPAQTSGAPIDPFGPVDTPAGAAPAPAPRAEAAAPAATAPPQGDEFF